jgi:hypothetical protein
MATTASSSNGGGPAMPERSPLLLALVDLDKTVGALGEDAASAFFGQFGLQDLFRWVGPWACELPPCNAHACEQRPFPPGMHAPPTAHAHARMRPCLSSPTPPTTHHRRSEFASPALSDADLRLATHVLSRLLHTRTGGLHAHTHMHPHPHAGAHTHPPGRAHAINHTSTTLPSARRGVRGVRVFVCACTPPPPPASNALNTPPATPAPHVRCTCALHSGSALLHGALPYLEAASDSPRPLLRKLAVQQYGALAGGVEGVDEGVCEAAVGHLVSASPRLWNLDLESPPRASPLERVVLKCVPC